MLGVERQATASHPPARDKMKRSSVNLRLCVKREKLLKTTLYAALSQQKQTPCYHVKEIFKYSVLAVT